MERFDFKKLALRQKKTADKANLNLIIKISTAVKKAGGRVLIVGGFVRDLVREKKNLKEILKDIDLEVYGLPSNQLKKILWRFGKINLIGESFSVFKLGCLEIAMPRVDSKIAPGHKGFKVAGDPNLSFKQAAQRRDFTINALGLDPLTGEIIDEVGGAKDIKNKILRAVNLRLFSDDPLRVLRAVQFAGRFDLKIDKKTLSLCQKIVRQGKLEELAGDRIREEWLKLFLKSSRPGKGLEAAKQMGIFKKYLPILEKTATTKQDQQWHPEGDVFIHTCQVVDRMAKIIGRQKLSREESIVLMLAAICHDLGKTNTTKKRDVRGQMRITSYGHEETSRAFVKDIIKFFHLSSDLIKKVENLTGEHMFIYQSRKQEVTDAAIKRLIVRLYPATLQELMWLAEADYPSQKNIYAGKKLLDHARLLDKGSVSSGKLKPIVRGRDLIKWGFKPGPEIGKILKELMDAQIEGNIKNLSGAREYLKNKKDDIIKLK